LQGRSIHGAISEKKMKLSRWPCALLFVFSVSAPLRAGETGIATCGPYEAYILVYRSVEALDAGEKIKCGEKFELLDEQKTYASQHTPFLRIQTAAGTQGFVPRAAVTVVHERFSPAPRGPVVAANAPVAPLVIPSEVRVPDGTALDLEITSAISSETTAEGVIVSLSVAEPVVIGGVTVFERGAAAHARVTAVKKAGRIGHVGELSWTLQDVTSVDGQHVPGLFILEASHLDASGKSSGAVVATGDATQVGGDQFGLRRGKPAIIPAGQRFKAFVHGDATVKIPQMRASQ
jgi:hypothetical protein